MSGDGELNYKKKSDIKFVLDVIFLVVFIDINYYGLS